MDLLFFIFVGGSLLIMLLVWLLFFSKKKISLKDIENIDWKLLSKSNDSPKLKIEEILESKDLRLEYRYPVFKPIFVNENIKITSRSRRGRIEVCFSVQNGNVTDSYVPGIPYGSRDKQWAYELRTSVHKVIKRYQSERA